jgi:hypothetical protein
MTEPSLQAPLRRNAGVAFLTLVASTGTLVCCVLPAVMVSLGAGAALAGLVTAVPQLVWLSAHKGSVFGVAGGLLLLSGALLWRGRHLPCPADPRLAKACRQLRRGSVALWAIAALLTSIGALFAFVFPRWLS